MAPTRGIRKMKDYLPPLLLKEKLPRFLQKCAQTFEDDRRYRNDMRYLRVWIQLLDFVDDPRALLKTMETNRIGTKLALFYQAYALYYEKLKKFEEAEKMFHLGVQNLAEPAGELQKSYDKFLQRMELYKKRKAREGRIAMRPLTVRDASSQLGKEAREESSRMECGASATGSKIFPTEAQNNCKIVGNKMETEESTTAVRNGRFDPDVHLPPNHLGILANSSDVGKVSDPSIEKQTTGIVCPKSSFKQQENTGVESFKPNTYCNDDTVVVKFVDTAIVGKSEAEDACHHGLVDPTINMKEAMNAINNMFREPLDMQPVGKRRSQRNHFEINNNVNNGFEVFVDEGFENGVGLADQSKGSGELRTRNHVDPTLLKKHTSIETRKPPQETFKIFVDDECDDSGDNNNENNGLACHVVDHSTEGSLLSDQTINAFVFPGPKDLPSNGYDDLDVQSSPNMKLREDTVVCRFVGSTILDDPEVENACHHGLVDPTINLKEAMDDINSMFGKPLDFVKTNRSKKQHNPPEKKRDSGFSILPDENLENQLQQQASLRPSSKLGSEFDLFEPTVCTKEAMDEINAMFGKPLDF
ncbi:PREDICTED: uncharacterized protein LOC104597306 isoform X2 [Nelumbo nucifera]|uniref:Uncharacterized protein LOC104597306 isoform X2 n=2 Tax=Nelumbo nucifera TaxID=4432 RepID=A0A1U7ZU25_NELNU|nr:PREDICTED: uncharacterized protein LOC104597306 isoform X2 [Nelumbo nucifera]DAD26301.1 TPA_asm: hypothetical protein HUJ06_027769 [Nelumbo nucifera]